MTKKDIKNVIKQEIKWCKSHRGNMPEDWEDGFINGLKQCIKLIDKLRVNE